MNGCFVCKPGGRLPYVFRDGRMEAVRAEVLMFPDFMLAQLRRYKQGLPFENCEVTLPMLATMA